MKIFYGDNDNRDFSATKRYAYLNWWFDNGYGENECSYQHIFDNYNMGKAFIGNALLSLNSILESNNSMGVADKIIFPVLFNSWHGLELWLKASVSAIVLLTKGQSIRRKGHEITQLTDELESLLRKQGCDDILLKAISPVKNIIDEFKRVNAHFDFARYSFDIDGEFQFYNAPYNSDRQWQSSKDNVLTNIVPNTCVDICNLFELLAAIFEDFGSFVEYLTLCLSEGGSILDKLYYEYLDAVESSEKMFTKYESDNMSSSEIILKAIMK